MVGIGKHREIYARLVFELVAQEMGLVVRVNADGEERNLAAVLFIKQGFQLTKLSGAVGSPIAAIKNQHDRLLAAITGELDGFAILVFENEVGRFHPNADPVQVSRRQFGLILRAEFGLSSNAASQPYGETEVQQQSHQHLLHDIPTYELLLESAR
jgi:hypothetical protein